MMRLLRLVHVLVLAGGIYAWAIHLIGGNDDPMVLAGCISSAVWVFMNAVAPDLREPGRDGRWGDWERKRHHA